MNTCDEYENTIKITCDEYENTKNHMCTIKIT